MSDTMNADSWLTGKSDGRRFLIACAAGLLLEAAGLAILLPAITHQQPPPAVSQSTVKLSIIAPAPPAPPPPKPQPVAPPKTVTPPPPPLPLAPPLPPVLPVPVAPNHTVIHHPPHRQHRPPVPPPPVPAATPPTPPAPAPPPAPPAQPQPSAGEINLFQAQMAAAVQRAATADYPQAAQMAHENGEVALSFVFDNGAISNVIILQSSGFPMLDAAAMQAVRDAHYPQPPPDFATRPHQVRVTVRFQTAPAEVDGD